MKVFTIFLLGIMVFSWRVNAFEINDLHSGMSEKAVLEVLSKRGLEINKIEPSKKGEDSYIARRKDSSLIEAVTLVNKKLTAYQYDVAGGIGSFIRMVEKASLVRGKGAYSAKTAETQVGQLNSISFYWISANEKFEISYSLINNDEQVSVIYLND